MGVKGGQRIATVGAALAMLASVPSGAGAATFGTNLAQPANAPLTCSDGVLTQAISPPQFIFGPKGGSCMWSSVVVGSASESLTAPGTGTVTAVRVKTGATTGPMQVNVIRFLFRQTGDTAHPELACCFLQAYGPVFTPAANATTTVPTNLPVQVDPTPPPGDTKTIAATDQLALSSLDPNVQVPLFATKNGESDLSVLSYGWYPAPTAGTTPAPSPNPIGGFADMSGFKVLMNADFTPSGGGGGGGGAPAGGGPAPGAPTVGPKQALPSFRLPKLTIPVKGNTATVPIQCLVVDCSGVLNLQSAQQAGAARATSAKKSKKKPKVVSYGTAKFSFKAGTTGKVKVKLNRAGRKLVKAHKKAKIWANVHFSSGGGKPKSTRVTLKR